MVWFVASLPLLAQPTAAPPASASPHPPTGPPPVHTHPQAGLSPGSPAKPWTSSTSTQLDSLQSSAKTGCDPPEYSSTANLGIRIRLLYLGHFSNLTNSFSNI
ncbi:MAG: hypothetical protein HGJ97_19100 [Desulfosporosinus sp.]|nr:hypothetical protein [Desulfosporosinus sp.]